MNPRYALFFKLLGGIILIVVLALLFPPIMEFIEMGSKDLKYLWWLVLLTALALWLIFGLGRRKK